MCAPTVNVRTSPVMASVTLSQGFAFFLCHLPAKHKNIDCRAALSSSQKLLQEENNLQLNFENFCPRASSHQPETVSEALRGHSRAMGLRTPAAGLLLGNSRESACPREGVPECPACVTVCGVGSGGYLSPCLRNHLCLNSWEFLIHSWTPSLSHRT